MSMFSRVSSFVREVQNALAYVLMAPILSIVARIVQVSQEETESHLAELEKHSPQAAAKAREAIRQIKGDGEGFLLPFSDAAAATPPPTKRKPGRPKLPSPPTNS